MSKCATLGWYYESSKYKLAFYIREGGTCQNLVYTLCFTISGANNWFWFFINTPKYNIKNIFSSGVKLSKVE